MYGKNDWFRYSLMFLILELLCIVCVLSNIPKDLDNMMLRLVDKVKLICAILLKLNGKIVSS